MNVSMDIAATITAAGIAIVNIGTLVLQIMQSKRSKENGRKIDEVHAATTAIAEQTGTYQTLKEPP